MQNLRHDERYAQGICQWIYNVCDSHLTYGQSGINYEVRIGNVKSFSSVSLDISPIWIFFVPYLTYMECVLKSEDSDEIKFLVTTYSKVSHPIFIFGLRSPNDSIYKLIAEVREV